jgi:hypothetical protein
MLADSVAALRAGIEAGAPVLRVQGGDAAMAILLVPIAGLAGFALRASLRGSEGAPRGGRGWIVAALIALPLTFAAPWIYGGWAEQMLGARGYVRCAPAGHPGRFPAWRYARSHALCAADR